MLIKKFSQLFKKQVPPNYQSLQIVATYNYSCSVFNAVEQDLFEPTTLLLTKAAAQKISLTFFIDMHCYKKLLEFSPKKASIFKEQIITINQHHDIQFFIKDSQSLSFEQIKQHKKDLEKLINRSINTIRTENTTVDYTFIKELKIIGITADSSLTHNSYHPHQPYFANNYNLHYLAPQAEQTFLELPIINFNNLKTITTPDSVAVVKLTSDNFESFFNNISQSSHTFATISLINQNHFNKNKKHTHNYQNYIANQIDENCEAIMGEQRNWEQSFYAQHKIPQDRKLILDLGCGSGYWTDILDKTIGKTIGVDLGKEFIEKARKKYPYLEFHVMDFHNLQFKDTYFDCVYADNVLEHAADPNTVLTEIYRILSSNGVLIALIPPDARNPLASSCCHTWKTDFDDIKARLQEIGFKNIIIEDINIKQLGMTDYKPSKNSMLYIEAWKL